MTKTDATDNRQIRVFISSTFRDMMAERDYLITKVFPVLRRYCEERELSLFELDLRWGISEEEAKQGKVVEICLDEVQKQNLFLSDSWANVMAGCPQKKNAKLFLPALLKNSPG